ncbi:MAG: M16 family metallopeptidase, partial [Planctomycetota bacterium]
RDNWQSELSYLFKKEFFDTSPYRYGPLGEKDTVEDITRKDVVEFYRHHAIPEQSVVTIFGDVEAEQAKELVEKQFGTLPPEDVPDRTIKRERPRESEKTVDIPVDRQISAVMMGYPGMALTNSKDRFAMEVLDAVLSGIGYPGGWLQEALRGGDRDLVYVVHAFNFMGLEPGYFGIMAASSPSTMDRVIAIIKNNVDRIKNGDVNKETLSTAKNMCVTMKKLQNQTNADMALQHGLDELYGLGYGFPDTYEARIGKVTVKDLKRVAQKYLKNPLILRLNGNQMGF